MEFSLDFFLDGQLRAEINNQYCPKDLVSLREKLGQYPSGTTFRLTVLGQEDGLVPILRAVNEAALEHGLTIDLAH